MIRSIICCCGSGLGSSIMLEMNLRRALDSMGITEMSTGHASISEISPDAADLFITGKDTAQQLRDYPRVIVLSKILSLEELTAKLRTAFEEEAERFVIE